MDCVKSIVGSVLWCQLKKEASCVWCDLLLVGVYAREAKRCAKGHPVCGGCWAWRDLTIGRKSNTHIKCHTCNCFYGQHPTPFMPAFYSQAWGNIPMEQCPFRSDSLECQSWCALDPSVRTLGLWLTSHFRWKCDFDPIPCSHCFRKIPRGQTEVHKMTECPQRKVVCDECKESYVWNQRSRHLEHCAEAQVPCPHRGCTTIMPRKNLEAHREKCDWKLLRCAACDRWIANKDMALHADECDMNRPIKCPVTVRFPEKAQMMLPQACRQPIRKYQMSEHLRVHDKIHRECMLSVACDCVDFRAVFAITNEMNESNQSQSGDSRSQ